MHLEFRQILWGPRPDSMGHRGKLASPVPSPHDSEGDRPDDDLNKSHFAPSNPFDSFAKSLLFRLNRSLPRSDS